MAASKAAQNVWQATKFTLFSISAGIVQVITFTLLHEVVLGRAADDESGLTYWVPYLIALVLSVVWNFTFNRRYTFRSAANVPVAMIKVAAYYAVFTPLSTMLGSYLADSLGWNEYLVTGLNMILNFVTEFLYQRYFVFGDSIDTAAKEK